jgi:hypothetical protein
VERTSLAALARAGAAPMMRSPIRVAAHERPLLHVQGTLLVEDRVGDGDLADIVQLGGLLKLRFRM